MKNRPLLQKIDFNAKYLNGQNGLPFIVHYAGDNKFIVDKGAFFDLQKNQVIDPFIIVDSVKKTLVRKWAADPPLLAAEPEHTKIYFECKSEKLEEEDEEETTTVEIKSAAVLPLSTVLITILEIAEISRENITVGGEDIETVKINQKISSNVSLFLYKKHISSAGYSFVDGGLANYVNQPYFTAFCKVAPNNTFLTQSYYYIAGYSDDGMGGTQEDWEAIDYTIVDYEIVASDPRVISGIPTPAEPYCNVASGYYEFTSPILYTGTPIPTPSDTPTYIGVGASSQWFGFQRSNSKSTDVKARVYFTPDVNHFELVWPKKIKLIIYRNVTYDPDVFTGIYSMVLEESTEIILEETVDATDITNGYVEFNLADLTVDEVTPPPTQTTYAERIGSYGNRKFVGDDGTIQEEFNSAKTEWVEYQFQP